MAGDTKKLQPIIIKKVKKGGHGAHGGAWKIAYADFVTAMMAFFLLMWLLGSTTEGDRKGIADYFNAPLKVAFTGGSGSGDSSHVIKGGGKDLSRVTGQVKSGDMDSKRTMNLAAVKEQQARAEKSRLAALKSRLEKQISEDPRFQQWKSQIRLDMTAEGLRIQIVDDGGRPMFASGSAKVQPYMRDLLRDMGKVLGDVPNQLTIEGHTDARPYSSGEQGYSNWELSADRANASRRELLDGGLQENRVLRVQGLAASLLLVKDDGLHPTNRRISIIVMNREAEDRVLRTAQELAEVVDDGAASPAAESASLPASGRPALNISPARPITPAVGRETGSVP